MQDRSEMSFRTQRHIDVAEFHGWTVCEVVQGGVILYHRSTPHYIEIRYGVVMLVPNMLLGFASLTAREDAAGAANMAALLAE